LNVDFNNKTFLRLSAERDIKPESDSANKLRSNGDGATNIIQKFLNKADYESNLVENQLLDYLNIIMEPDASFDRVLVQQYVNDKWEVFLEEKEKGKISLSDSGSGLKTIILILSFILLIPEFENKVLDSYIFAFEELENNLHPALQRRLFKFLSDFVIENNINAFITTHSNVPIDMFNINKDAQIYHVLHDGKTSNVDIVKTYVELSFPIF
jgi:AAA15 family ATPase/GTPase